MKWRDLFRREEEHPTREEALAVARKYGLEGEVRWLIDTRGWRPREALEDWDIFYEEEI